MTRAVLVLLLASFAGTLSAQQHAPRGYDVVVLTERSPPCVELTIAWSNAFRTERNHDAAWLVLRGPDATRAPLRLGADGHHIDGRVDGAIAVADDRLGAFVHCATPYRGDVAWRVTLALAEPPPADVKAWAVGMVLVPGGGFDLGDDEPTLRRFGAFHRVPAAGAEPSPFRVENEDEIEIANTPGALWYERDRDGYRGDQGGPLPAAWPKGTLPFYVMKRELTQGEYAGFLSALPERWQRRRAPLDLRGEETESCTIARDGTRFVARAPDRPCNFVSWDDTCALYDWLALRPMTEFEFEKAARGPRRPVAGDYPWGTASAAGLARTVQRSRDLASSSVADEQALDDATKARLGASFYWVMDLSGSVWERVVSAGHAAGRAFTGSHGDGVLSAEGDATNADWPRMDGGDAPGMGYRGGAEYWTRPDPANPTNPHSPVGVRTYAGWGGAQRDKTYSARAARTAPR